MVDCEPLQSAAQVPPFLHPLTPLIRLLLRLLALTVRLLLKLVAPTVRRLLKLLAHVWLNGMSTPVSARRRT